MDNYYTINNDIIQERANVIKNKIINNRHINNIDHIIYNNIQGIELNTFIRTHYLLGEPAWGPYSPIYYIASRF